MQDNDPELAAAVSDDELVGTDCPVADILSEITNAAEEAGAGGKADGVPSPGRRPGRVPMEPFYEDTQDPMQLLNNALETEEDDPEPSLDVTNLPHTLHAAMLPSLKFAYASVCFCAVF